MTEPRAEALALQKQRNISVVSTICNIIALKYEYLFTILGAAMKEKILIIEDEAAIREMIGYTLMKEGYRFEEAEDVEAARALIAKNNPDLILMDWMLPGMSGLEFTRRLALDPDTREIPVIMLTARSE